MTINISRLEEKTITKNSNCSLLSDLNDFLQYECKSQLDEGITLSNIKKISIEPLFFIDGVKVNVQGKMELINIFELKEDQYKVLTNNNTNILSFYSGTLELNKEEQAFYINKLQYTQNSELNDSKISGDIFLF